MKRRRLIIQGDTIEFIKLPERVEKIEVYEIYTREQEELWGALGIRIRLIE
ncbi:hypothetical protein [Paenibacillus psychroresistens]|uniref:hypothetical protein n=1 Tax=Paenibacillus psychroresistens TaxID=1778678 RepID=UPI0012DA2F11|nr:hypothetical protein [Paenibacillus psychroresistens]